MAQETFNRMVRDTALTRARETLNGASTHIRLLQIIDDAIEFSENLRQEMTEHEIDGLDDIDCQTGCAWCCYQQVGVTAPQALHIAKFLRTGNSSLTTEEAMSRLEAADKKLHGLDKIDRLAVAEPCVFLSKGNTCEIYAVRPFACRGANSIDAEFCRRLVEELNEVRGELDNDGGRPWIHALPFQSMAALQDAILTATTEVGLSEEKLELTAAVRIALAYPDAAQKWCDGEDIFVAARLKSI